MSNFTFDNVPTDENDFASITKIGEQFLLTEYETIRHFKEQSVAVADKRVDIFLTLSSALVATLVLLSQTAPEPKTFVTISFIGVLGLFALGLATFRQVLDRDVLIVDYIRSINRIRAYFAKQTPDIQPYLLMPVSHLYPEYKWVSSNRSTLMVINSFSVSAALILIGLLLQANISIDPIYIALAALAFVMCFWLQRWYAERFFKRAEDFARKSHTVSLHKSRYIAPTE